MAWLWQRDIDDEKRTPGFIFRLRGIFSKPVRPEKVEKELKALGVKPGSNVLDFGCGRGEYSIAAAKIVGDSGSVQALDLHPVALETVEKKAARHSLSNIDTIFSDLETGLENESMDAVFLFDVLKGRKEIRLLLGEMHRILNNEGVIHVRNSGLKDGRLKDLMVKDGLFSLRNKQGNVFSFGKVRGEFHEI